MRKPRTPISWLVLVLTTMLTATLTFAGCAAPAQIDASGAQIIDVRTPAEYAEGHLQGAVNLDIQAADFAAQLETLAKDGRYIVYCRAGNRSAAATQTMTAAGFTNIQDAGGMEIAAKALNLPVVN